MISPLGQRQIFQTANVEAVRQAQEVGEEIQRDIMKMKAAEDRLAEDQNSVRNIPEFERVLTEERKEGRGQPGMSKQKEEKAREEKSKEEEDQAGAADSRLNFLA